MRRTALLVTLVLSVLSGPNASAIVLSFDDITGYGPLVYLGPGYPPLFGLYNGFQFGST
jgi:hypothetical protein